MAGTAVDLITSQTLGSPANFQFTSIPSTYTDLMIVIVGWTASGSDNAVNVYFNGNTSSYQYVRLGISGTGTFSDSGTYPCYVGLANGGSIAGSNVIHVLNYTQAAPKHIIGELFNQQTSNSTGGRYTTWGMWNNTSTINQVNLSCSASTFQTGNTAYLYGWKRA